jgi:hypothetical protein
MRAAAPIEAAALFFGAALAQFAVIRLSSANLCANFRSTSRGAHDFTSGSNYSVDP